MTKGKRRERQAANAYRDAGWRVAKPQESQYGETDMFGLFDFVAIRPGLHVDWVQVKANDNNLDMGPYFGEACPLLPARNSAVYLICYDREGWRAVLGRADGTHRTVCDERELAGTMAHGLTEWLQNDPATTERVP